MSLPLMACLQCKIGGRLPPPAAEFVAGLAVALAIVAAGCTGAVLGAALAIAEAGRVEGAALLASFCDFGRIAVCACPVTPECAVFTAAFFAPAACATFAGLTGAPLTGAPLPRAILTVLPAVAPFAASLACGFA